MTENTQENVVENQQPSSETPVPGSSVEAQCAKFLLAALPIFRAKLDQLQERNKTEVARVLSAVMEAGLEQETHKFTTDKAQELYDLAMQILSAKHVLFNAALKLEDEGKLEKVEEPKEQSNGN